MNLELLADVVLVAGSIILACMSLAVRQLFTAIVLYISLGLLATIVWVRLNAWDVAIAEAAIGAGLTGALFLIAWRRLSGKPPVVMNPSSLEINELSEVGVQEPSAAPREPSATPREPSAARAKKPSAARPKEPSAAPREPSALENKEPKDVS